jgi:hypothetical protein
MVGTVKGTKLWAGECVASEPTGSVAPEGEKSPLVELGLKVKK